MTRLDRASAWLTARRWPTYLSSALFATLLAWITLDLFTIDWRIPIAYWGDSLAVGSHMKTVLETGWISHQPELGAPYGQFYGDYPQADNIGFIFGNLFRPFVHDFGYVMNVEYVIGFPLAAVCATGFLRLIGVSRILSVTFGVVYALAPYHFQQGEMHLFLSQYFVVPLALGLIYRVAVGRRIWALRPGKTGVLKYLSWRNGSTILIVALLGTASSYYSVFIILLLTIVGIARVWLTRRWRAFWGAVVVGVLIVVVMVINLLPSLLYSALNGPNPSAFVRSPPEAEINSFKLAALMLPVPYHHFGPFADLRSLYDKHYPLPSEQPSLGILAAIGLVLALALMVFFLLSSGRNRWKAPRSYSRTLSVLSGLLLIAILFGTVGGVSTFLSFLNFPVRTWVRLVIVIGMLALAVLAIMLDRLIRKWAAHGRVPRRARVLIAAPLALLLMGFAAWDQAPTVDEAQRSGWAQDFGSDEAFVQKIEATVPSKDCLIYQLPYMPFPESAQRFSAIDSDQLRLFLHSDTLRWSGGGIKGRPEIDEIGSYASLPVPEMLKSISDLGACGVAIDTAGFPPGQAMQLADQIETETHGERFTARNGRFVFVSL